VSVEVWLGSPEAALQFDIDGLSPDERVRYEGIKGERRRREFAVSRALRQTALGNASGDPSQPSSLSHSGGWAAVARAAPGCQIGVDLEFHRPRNLLGIARFAFDPAEIAMIEAQLPQQQHEVFFTLWTLKESMAKALGLPLLAAARQCVFTLDEVGVLDSSYGRIGGRIGTPTTYRHSGHSGTPIIDAGPKMGTPIEGREAGAATDSVGVQFWRGQVPTDRPWMARVFRPRPDMALCVAVIGSDRLDWVITREWPAAKGEEWRSVVALSNGTTP
jgi:hypothetical protein